jgi:hypothetical protein
MDSKKIKAAVAGVGSGVSDRGHKKIPGSKLPGILG